MSETTPGYRLKLAWFYVRSHFTKALGTLVGYTGYAIEHQAQWVHFLSDKPRGLVLKYTGLVVFLLGVYNWLHPPIKPENFGAPPNA